MRRWILRLGLGLLALALLLTLARRLAFDPAPWQAEYALVREHLTRTYANLQWQVDVRGLDLVELDARTRAAIEEAGSDTEAALALQRFLEAFGDGHLRFQQNPPWLWALIHWLPATDPDPMRSSLDANAIAAWPAETACDELGFTDDYERELMFDVGELERWKPLPADQPFAGGTFDSANRTVGLLRIPIFDQYRYRAVCLEAWAARPTGEPCDAECLNRFRWHDVPQALIAEVTDNLDRMGDVDVLVVDVTGNGGGTDWEDIVARTLTRMPLDCPRVSGIKHPHWHGRADEPMAAIERALGTPDLEARVRGVLTEARERFERWDAELREECDLNPLWSGQDPGCSLLSQTPVTACGALAHVTRDDLAGVPNPGEIYRPWSYEFEAGKFGGRLIVAVDHRTASSAEYFAGILQDHGATVIGERTAGAGAGYSYGGLPLTLPHSGLVLLVPDGARWRKNGENEVAGISPDRAVDWSEGNPTQSLLKAL
jgi:hypothetical protein